MNEHHNGLRLEELRGLLSGAEANFKVHIYLVGEPRKSCRELLARNAAEAQAELDGFDEGTGWVAVLAKFGWELWDVSEHVLYDRRTYRCFVGTREELSAAYPCHQDASKPGGDA